MLKLNVDECSKILNSATVMQKSRFTITFEIVTRESSQNGDAEFRGYVTESFDTPREAHYLPEHPATFTLREAFDFFTGIECEGKECDSSPWHPGNPPRWVNICGRLDEYDECTSYALHPAKRNGITGASMCRLARLFSCYGEHKLSLN